MKLGYFASSNQAPRIDARIDVLSRAIAFDARAYIRMVDHNLPAQPYNGKGKPLIRLIKRELGKREREEKNREKK